MIKQIFYSSSLPRSGSTLFQNIMADNPAFYCTPTSGVADLILNAKNIFNQSQAFQAQDLTKMEPPFVEFCRKGMQGFFDAITDAPYVLDKSREWNIHYNLLDRLFPNPKMICMVRDPRAIYASMEKNFRKNPLRENNTQDVAKLIGTTLDKRINMWADSVPIGVSMDRLKDCFQQGIDKKMLFIRYEDLMANPEQEIRRVYEYLELPYYEGHNFETVTQHTQENDYIHGVYGDHKLRTKFEKLPDDHEEILGYELSLNIKNTYPWFYTNFGYI
jgi:sulfotransferase